MSKIVLNESDQVFFDKIIQRLPDNSPIPLFINSDGTLNREKILQLPCFNISSKPDGFEYWTVEAQLAWREAAAFTEGEEKKL